jgi:transglutaminase-like putative cysteine protease
MRGLHADDIHAECASLARGRFARTRHVRHCPGAFRYTLPRWIWKQVCQDPGSPRQVKNKGRHDHPVDLAAEQHAVADLPPETLVYLLGSRYCDVDLMTERAWALFGGTPFGWGRVQAICDFVHRHITFGYQHARPTRTAEQAFAEQRGVCRDFAHLSITFCRCLNIPARYCTGYLGDIGVPPDPAPMDFSAWFEAFVGGRWYTFDARHNIPRIGRVLVARGRDAADVAISTTFGTNSLRSFHVITHEVPDTPSEIESPKVA